MKIWKLSLRLWITAASLFSFLGGWIVLAHSPKPVQFDPAAYKVPALAPVPSLEELAGRQDQNINFNSVRPVRMRTGGS